MAKGGKRPGAGAPKGTIQKRTLEREKVARALRERITLHTDQLFNAQFSLAKGSTYVYRVEEKQLDNGKSKREHILVTDPDEIKDVLDSNEGFSGQVKNKYYIITTAAPDNRAIDSMFDRAFGKAPQSLKIEDDAGILKSDVRLIVALKTIKDIIDEQGVSFEQAATFYFEQVRPDHAAVREQVTPELLSEAVN